MNKELSFINHFANPHIGDDGAVIDGYVYSKDAFFENVHFKREWMSLYSIARKAMLVNLSDAIAMNAKPHYVLLAVAMPPCITESEMEELYRGFHDTAQAFGCEIIGGDTIANTKLDITVTVISKTKNPLMRKGLKAGDLIAYTGALGESKRDLDRLFAGETVLESSRFINPTLRSAFITKAAPNLRCGLDISDGLFSELERLSSLNRVGFQLFAPIPTEIGCSGEEYEMLIGFHPHYLGAIRYAARRTNTPLTIIGEAILGKYKNPCKANHF